MGIIFVTIDFITSGKLQLLDYPKHLPIPRIGEQVLFNNLNGCVCMVRYITNGDVTEIKIICKTI